MLRHLARHFQRALTLQPSPKNLLVCAQLPHRTLFHIELAKAATTTANGGVPIEPTEPLPEVDTEYIVPYRVEDEAHVKVNAFLEALRTRFRLSTTEVRRIMSDESVQRLHRERSLVRTLDALSMEGVNKRSFIDYPWLMTLDLKRVELKLALIRNMNMRDINHFIAFFRLSLPRLRKLVNALQREKDTVPFGNRIYYISERLQSNPYLVSKYLSKRLFVLEMPFDMLVQNLNHMVDYNVSPLNVLKDLWAFRYTPKSVQLRLERAKRAKKDKIMPWMVRCPEPILQRSFKLTLDELAVLGDKTSVLEYVAARLDFTVDETKAIMAKHPQVNRVRVTKIKEVLDYLLDEAGFNRYEIAQVPRVICHSLETTKQRLEELKSYGCRPTSLVIVCRSKREYDKFVQHWLSMQTIRKPNLDGDSVKEVETKT